MKRTETKITVVHMPIPDTLKDLLIFHIAETCSPVDKSEKKSDV